MPPSRPITGPEAAQGEVPVGWCRIRPDDSSDLVVLIELGDSYPRITQGFGGWDEVERTGRTSITHWRGHAPLALELELFFDDHDDGKSVEAEIDTLEALGGRGRKRIGGGQPPLLKVDTAGVMPHDVQADPDTRWVITDLEFDQESAIRNDHGNRVRQTVTVGLLQYVADDRLQDRALAMRQQLAKRKKTAKRTYRAKKGDTLMSIARAKLGDAGRWREIQRLNPKIRDPRAVKAGAVIRLP